MQKIDKKTKRQKDKKKRQRDNGTKGQKDKETNIPQNLQLLDVVVLSSIISQKIGSHEIC